VLYGDRSRKCEAARTPTNLLFNQYGHSRASERLDKGSGSYSNLGGSDGVDTPVDGVGVPKRRWSVEKAAGRSSSVASSFGAAGVFALLLL
jgi:hypothetical protein